MDASRFWWGLPGPQVFLNRTLSHLRDGRSVAILLPRFGPDPRELGEHVRSDWQEYGDFVSVRATAGKRPAAFLAKEFNLGSGTAFAPSAFPGALAGHHPGSVIFIPPGPVSDPDVWRRFMQDYAHASLHIPLDRRPLLLLLLEAEADFEDWSEDVGLAVERWDDVLSELDCLLFAMFLLRQDYHGSAENAERRLLAATTLAWVGLFDRELMILLAREDPLRLLDPSAFLVDFGLTRGWQKTTVPSWKEGSLQRVGGRTEVHSSILALRSQLSQRLWRTQVGVLLPVLEEFRLEFVRRHLANRLLPPFGTANDSVDSVDELSLGAICHHMRARRIHLDSGLMDLMVSAADARNDLAHGRPVGSEGLKTIERAGRFVSSSRPGHRLA